jgi:hypothetical protein
MLKIGCERHFVPQMLWKSENDAHILIYVCISKEHTRIYIYIYQEKNPKNKWLNYSWIAYLKRSMTILFYIYNMVQLFSTKGALSLHRSTPFLLHNKQK